MPQGDPAGYLPSVIKKRLKKDGQAPYKARSKQGAVKLKPSIPKKAKVPKPPFGTLRKQGQDAARQFSKFSKRGA